MKRFRIICISIVLCLSFGCMRSEKPASETSAAPPEVWQEDIVTGPKTETAGLPTVEPAPEEEPAQRPAPEAEKESALLYESEHVNLYCGRSADSWGIIMEERQWVGENLIYQPLPGTAGSDGLTVTEILPEPDDSFSDAMFYIRYLDADRTERIFCLDHPASDFADFYPVTDEPEFTPTEQEQSGFEDLMLIGFLYECFRWEYAETNPDDWETMCQRAILDALYSVHDDTLPPYLSGETGEGFSVVTQPELDSFFRCTVNRPNCVPDRTYDGEERPDLLPGQVPVSENDWSVWATLNQAVRAKDGSVTLYGYARIGDTWASQSMICSVVSADGPLGWRIERTEVCSPTDMQLDPSIVFSPAR